MILLYDTITGSSMGLAKKFSLPSKERSWYEGNKKAVLISRRFLIGEKLWELERFIHEYKKDIIGVIIYDDKMFGTEFGNSAPFFEKNGVRILAIWDKNISEEEIKEMEVIINEAI